MAAARRLAPQHLGCDFAVSNFSSTNTISGSSVRSGNGEGVRRRTAAFQQTRPPTIISRAGPRLHVFFIEWRPSSMQLEGVSVMPATYPKNVMPNPEAVAMNNLVPGAG